MKLKTAAIAIITLFATGVPSAMAEQNPYGKPYDAVYDYTIPGSGSTTLRLSCDGQGKLRSESTIAGRSVVSITDWNSKTTYSIDDTSKTVNKMPSAGGPGAPPVDESKRTSLGDKMIDGRLCEGWQYVSQGQTSQSWTDKDVGCAVLMTLDGKPQMKLKSATKGSIAAQYFQVPAGYRVVDMQEQIRRAQEMAKKYQKQR